MEQGRSSEDENNQKTHYMITRRNLESNLNHEPGFQQIFNQLSENKSSDLIVKGNPFIRLLNGKETTENVNLRFKLFELIWQHQYLKIQNILNQVNLDLFEELNEFIHEINDSNKLDIGFLQLSSNIANNLRILTQFHEYSQAKIKSNQNYKFVTLSSKYCLNIKLSLREIVRQFLEDKSNGLTVDLIQGRLNYDMDIVQDWYDLQKSSSIKIVLIIQDSNSINNQILNQIIKIISSYKAIPFKLILGISTNNISEWINDNINYDLKIAINNYKFKSLDNSNLGFKILDELFLKFNSEFELPLFLLYSKLSSILLNRFENSNNSIDMLISQIKLCYMIHFYQSPISVLIENTFDLYDNDHKIYLKNLKRLSSFKKFIELKIYNNEYKLVTQLLEEDNSSIIEEFNRAKIQFNKYKLVLINLINIIDVIQNNLNEIHQPKFTIYDLIANGKFLNSLYLSTLFKKIQNLSSFENIINDLDHLIKNYQIFTKIADDQTGELIFDEKLEVFFNEIHKLHYHDGGNFLASFQSYLNNELLFKSIDQYLFYEIFTLDGGDLNQSVKLPENLENLMINLVRPNLRLTIEQSLDNPAIYFKNELISSENYQLYPTLTQLFSIYKQAPVNINIYDFFTTFQYSLNKLQIEKILNQKFDDSQWNQLTYAWFIQNCHELMLLGFLKEKPKGDVLEKATWIGV